MYDIELTEKAQRAYDESDYRIVADRYCLGAYHILNYVGRRVATYLTEDAVSDWFEELAEDREAIG